jgi:preprotein translocase subunit YajC
MGGWTALPRNSSAAAGLYARIARFFNALEEIPVFISNAYAAGSAAAPDWTSFLPLIVIFVLFWFMLIRPQMKQAKEHRKMLEALQKGDEVATSGGLAGRITKVGDSFIGLEIAPDVTVQVQKHTVQTLLPKGTLKSL